MDNRIKVLTAVLLAVAIIPLLGVAMQPKQVPLDEEWLLVNDKPYIETALIAEEEYEEWQAEQDAIEESYYYYVPSYSGSVWYESDDADAEYEAKEWIAFRESGGDYGARNGQYVGRYQLNEMYLDGDYSEENQEAAAEAYIADRYGSWQAAQEHWREYGWY